MNGLVQLVPKRHRPSFHPWIEAAGWPGQVCRGIETQVFQGTSSSAPTIINQLARMTSRATFGIEAGLNAELLGRKEKQPAF